MNICRPLKESLTVDRLVSRWNDLGVPTPKERIYRLIHDRVIQPNKIYYLKADFDDYITLNSLPKFDDLEQQLSWHSLQGTLLQSKIIDASYNRINAESERIAKKIPLIHGSTELDYDNLCKVEQEWGIYDHSRQSNDQADAKRTDYACELSIATEAHNACFIANTVTRRGSNSATLTSWIKNYCRDNFDYQVSNGAIKRMTEIATPKKQPPSKK